MAPILVAPAIQNRVCHSTGRPCGEKKEEHSPGSCYHPNIIMLKDSFFKPKRNYKEIDPDEILLDSRNIPDLDTDQFEGRLERPISRSILHGLVGLFIIIAGIFVVQSWKLSITHGAEYRLRSEKNSLRPSPLFAGRGLIYDRKGELLAWNVPQAEDEVPRREYATSTGLAHILGYVRYPSKDSNGFYYREDFEGVDGVENYFNEELRGVNGSRLIEVDARNTIVSQNVVRLPEQGNSLKLSIDSHVQSALYRNIENIASGGRFVGGAGLIMDVNTGEIIAMTSYPEYSPQIMSDNTDNIQVKALLNAPGLPFLDRAADGLYAPGSIVKPYIALGILEEKIIEPDAIVVTTGSISIPNPYDPNKTSVFRDWKNHGPLDMRRAIAVSSDAYFYITGGGYKDQKGLGILNMDRYLNMFGFGMPVPASFAQGKAGTIPSPPWKKKTFNEDWYIGDTYHTAIGQYGFQVTPLQVVRAVAAIANGGNLLAPTIISGDKPKIDHVIDIPAKNFDIVREGMRMSVESGTSQGMNVPYVRVATKSGTAELGKSKEKINSWITGFFPYEKPRYAFVIILEKGLVKDQSSAGAVMRRQLDWMKEHAPEYFLL
ncbi:MAG: hypothetical protein A3B11_01105 [Candidatus Taylorbacteria bacterium RIFCSPLOWO2_01_FULL_44_26]|uniref:Penicillin-binding protein 2 n=2 Tax=Candidatus Tayloriibacteriota TaxID=1817919 RepID=A0A1G2N5T1_9BACT|nr:MAG: hypothetical protein A3B11_01105 [Candidatus Taylorbacteria bacterium RIFCSPLOWO2_01_FULL_44_26]